MVMRKNKGLEDGKLTEGLLIQGLKPQKRPAMPPADITMGKNNSWKCYLMDGDMAGKKRNGATRTQDIHCRMKKRGIYTRILVFPLHEIAYRRGI